MTTQVETLVVLSPEIYKQIEHKFSLPIVTQQTTDIQAGYLLGVQAVLRELRNEYTIQRSK